MYIFNTVLLLATAAAALPQAGGAPQVRPWIAPGSNDLRSPCPMVNTLANHGYLPHDGRNVTIADFGFAVSTALNVDETYGTIPASFFGRVTNRTSWNLDDLHIPGVIEHPASLTRLDATDENATSKADPERLQRHLNNSPMDFLDAKFIALTRVRVEDLSKPVLLSPNQAPFAFLEATLSLVMMLGEIPDASTNPGNDAWQPRKDRLNVWFSEERLPVELGWRPTQHRGIAKDLIPPMKAIYDEYVVLKGVPNNWEAFSAVVIPLIGAQ